MSERFERMLNFSSSTRAEGRDLRHGTGRRLVAPVARTFPLHHSARLRDNCPWLRGAAATRGQGRGVTTMTNTGGGHSRLRKGAAVLFSLVGIVFGFVSPSDVTHD